jgi:hypothetical protein
MERLPNDATLRYSRGAIRERQHVRRVCGGHIQELASVLVPGAHWGGRVTKHWNTVLIIRFTHVRQTSGGVVRVKRAACRHIERRCGIWRVRRRIIVIRDKVEFPINHVLRETVTQMAKLKRKPPHKHPRPHARPLILSPDQATRDP